MTQKEVISRGYAKEIYEFARNNHNADIELLTQELLKSRRLPERYSHSILDEEDEYYDYPVFEDYDIDYYYYLFARDINGANVSLLESKLDEFNDKIIYEFARDVEGANIELLQSKMKIADPKYIYLFARDVETANVTVLQDYLLGWLPEAYDMDYSKYVILFAQDIEGINIDKMISDIKSFISNCHSCQKQLTSDYYVNTLEQLINELEVIKSNKKSNTLTKIRKI